MMRTLIIDDDPFLCDILTSLLARLDLQVDVAHSLQEGLAAARSVPYDLIYLDVILPDGDGLAHLDRILGKPGAPTVIVITGTGDSASAERALYRGAWDYILKPIAANDVLQATRQALAQRQKNQTLAKTRRNGATGIIGCSPKLEACLSVLLQAATTGASCLIFGETGTGKELFARVIHEASDRAGKSFVVVDCTNIPENLAESVLFGHNKGSFTDARETREGLFKQADGGTLFLDEIGDLPHSTQKSLLRVLQE